MTAANSVSPTANPFVCATEPLDRVTWSLLMTSLPFLERTRLTGHNVGRRPVPEQGPKSRIRCADAATAAIWWWSASTERGEHGKPHTGLPMMRSAGTCRTTKVRVGGRDPGRTVRDDQMLLCGASC